MGFEIKGLKALQEKLNSLASLDGKKIPLGELLPPDFVSGSSKFSSVQELFDASGFTVNTQEDLKAIPDDKWDAFIVANTSYGGWQEMLSAATAKWIAKNT
jgi:hypothetical protein